MRRKCDKCDEPATNHSVEIVNGQKIEKHLCDEHAAEEGLIKPAAQHTSINELLTNFVKLHSGAEDADATAGCSHCGMTFEAFQESRLLGCPTCYTDFADRLTPLLERAHEGGEHHLGKVPRHAPDAERRQEQMLRMRKKLDDAIEAEDYELAAHLRDEIRTLEERSG